MAERDNDLRRERNVCAQMKFETPDLNKISCTTCAFREADRLGGKIKGATLGMCEVFEGKPLDIMFGRAKCPYYAAEDNAQSVSAK